MKSRCDGCQARSQGCKALQSSGLKETTLAQKQRTAFYREQHCESTREKLAAKKVVRA